MATIAYYSASGRLVYEEGLESCQVSDATRNYARRMSRQCHTPVYVEDGGYTRFGPRGGEREMTTAQIRAVFPPQEDASL